MYYLYIYPYLYIISLSDMFLAKNYLFIAFHIIVLRRMQVVNTFQFISLFFPS